MKSEEIIKYLDNLQRNRWNYLTNARDQIETAISQNQLFLSIVDKKQVKEYDHAWEITFEDNLNGLSFLHVPTVGYAKKCHPGASANRDLKENQIITSWDHYWTDGGNEWSDGYYCLSLRRFKPEAFIVKPNKICMYAVDADEFLSGLTTFKNWLIQSVENRITRSPLEIELIHLRKYAEQKRDDDLREREKHEKLMNDEQILNGIIKI